MNKAQKRAYGPIGRPAKSPRTQAKVTHSAEGTGGLAVSGGRNQSATVGQAGAGGTARRPKTNTNAKSQHGGMPITYYAPMERWDPTTARTSKDARRGAPASVQRPHKDGRPATGLAAEFAGLRMRANTERSVMINNGAIGTKTVLMRTQESGLDGINDRTIPVTVPVWAGDDTSDPDGWL